jgi:hypothetical protein
MIPRPAIRHAGTRREQERSMGFDGLMSSLIMVTAHG